MGIEENKPATTSPKDQSLLSLDGLIAKYKGVKGIPEEELNKIGYMKIGDSSIRAISAQEKIFAKEKTEQEAFVEKIKNSPFQEVLVAIEADSIIGRRLNEKEVYELKRKINKAIENFDPEYMSELDEYKNKTPFANKFQEFISKSELEIDNSIKKELTGNIFWGLLYNNNFQADAAEELEVFLKQIEVEYIEGEESKLMFSELERLKGRFSDIEEIEKEFTNRLENKIELSYMFADNYDEGPATKDYAKKNKLETIHELVIHFFSLLLRSENMEDIANTLIETKTLDGTRQFLKGNIPPLEASIFEEYKILKEKIKSVPIEEKKILNKRLGEIEEAKKKNINIINSIREYFNFPEIVSKEIKKELSDLQDFLARKGGKENYNLRLIGTPDKELDRDPGVMSGDCTEGKPLPFEDPNFPIYNIKVFKLDQEHIGNIYLLITKDIKHRKVWHLDAIQIPLTATWETSIAELFKSMGEKAQEKGVSFISVSKEDSHISNYDYIQKSVKDYAKKINLGDIDVDVASMYYSAFLENEDLEHIKEEKYSPPQGSGEDMIVWKNSNLP